MYKFTFKGYEIIIYPNLLTIVHGNGHGSVLYDAGNSLSECRKSGIRQAFFIYSFVNREIDYQKFMRSSWRSRTY